MSPTVFIVSEGLVAPPRVGFHVHLLSVARALAEHVDVRAVAWIPDKDSDAWKRWVASLPDGPDPETYLRPIAAGDRAGNAFQRKVQCWNSAQRLIEAEAKPGDVLWVRELPTALFAVPLWSKALPRRRELRHLYDVASIVELEMGLSTDVRFAGAKPAVEAWLRRRFDLVRTLGQGMKDFLVQRGVDPERIVVAPVGADVPAQAWSSRGEVRRLLYIGSNELWQGLPVLMQSMSSLRDRAPEVRLTVVGTRPEDLAGTDVPDNVDVVGWVDRARIGDLYREHDLFVIPRPSTPLTDTVIPMKSVEAQAHGIPILASDLGAIREVTGGESAHLVAPGDSEALVRGILELRSDPTRLAAMGDAARRRAEDLAWPSIGRSLVDDLFGR